jgi:hypothetical protein
MIVLLLLLVTFAHAADLTIICASQPMDKKQWWSYRLIDGHKCWYPGKGMLPRNQLRWRTPHLAETSVGQPDGSQLSAATSVAVAPFEQAWRNMWIDLHAALWLHPQPVAEWRIYK